MESRFLGGLLAFSFVLGLMILGFMAMRYFARISSEYRPQGGRWVGEGFLRFDDLTARGRNNLLKAGLCLGVVVVAVPFLPETLDLLVPQERHSKALPARMHTIALLGMIFASALLAWLLLTFVSIAQFLLAQRHATATWREAGWRRLYDSTCFDGEGRALRTNAKWLFLIGLFAFVLAQAAVAGLRALPPAAT